MITRALRCTVLFPGWRHRDLWGAGKEAWKDRTDLHARLRKAQDDVTRAANALTSALYLLEQGLLPWPEEARQRGQRRGEVSRVPLGTLGYRGLSGKWAPFGDERLCYRPSTPEPVSSAILLETAQHVTKSHARSLAGVKRGQQALQTFRELPIMLPAQRVKLLDNLDLTLSLWAGRSGGLTVRPHGLNRGQRAMLRACAEGRAKLGAVKLAWDPRRCKWALSMAYTLEEVAAQDAAAALVAGASLGFAPTVLVAYAAEAGGEASFSDTLTIPRDLFRAERRLDGELAARSRANRAEFGLRTGRGRGRKLRATEALRGKIGRMREDARRELAAALVHTLRRRGVQRLVLEDMAWWHRSMLRESEPLRPQERRARRRRWIISAYQPHATTQAIISACAREGMSVEVRDARVLGADRRARALQLAKLGLLKARPEDQAGRGDFDSKAG